MSIDLLYTPEIPPSTNEELKTAKTGDLLFFANTWNVCLSEQSNGWIEILGLDTFETGNFYLPMLKRQPIWLFKL